MQLEAESTAKDFPNAEDRETMLRHLSSLRELSAQLHKRAATADEHVLRAILGKRESILNGIRTLLSPPADAKRHSEATPQPVPVNAAGAAEESFAENVKEIASMDEESQRILKERAEKVADEIQKIKAGRKWRESCPKWK